MPETCCDALGRQLKSGKKFLTNRTASGGEWIPAFVQKVDAERCIGCGSCVKVCLGKCYELREIKVNGNARKQSFRRSQKRESVFVPKKKVAVVVHPENCFGDCHCHKVCPIIGGAMICKPKEIK